MPVPTVKAGTDVIPFELVQLTLLKQDYDEIKDLESKMAEIPSEYESILEEMTEDQKEACKDVLNEDGNAFVPKEVSKMVKMLKKDKTEESPDSIITIYKCFVC